MRFAVILMPVMSAAAVSAQPNRKEPACISSQSSHIKKLPVRHATASILKNPGNDPMNDFSRRFTFRSTRASKTPIRSAVMAVILCVGSLISVRKTTLRAFGTVKRSVPPFFKYNVASVHGFICCTLWRKLSLILLSLFIVEGERYFIIMSKIDRLIKVFVIPLRYLYVVRFKNSNLSVETISCLFNLNIFPS